MPEAKFEEWAILELFGHQRLAGKVSECQLGGASFVRVEVPADGKKKGWKLSKLYNPSAIYSIMPVTENTARVVAANLIVEPYTQWDIKAMMARTKSLAAGDDEGMAS